MDDPTLLRYSRHILLDEIGVEGQERLRASTALVIGAGGLGSPVSIYLAAAGVGRLVLFDADRVDLTNLQRQILHTTDRLGMPKVESARTALAAINHEVRVETHGERATAERLAEHLAGVGVVVDCSDNRATRYAANRACRKAQIPLVSGAASGFAGQLAVFDFRLAQSPCYACLFPEDAQGEDEPCATTGVYAPLTGVIGSLQASEAIKILAGAGTPATEKLIRFDALPGTFQELRFGRDPRCGVCG